jgi:hypothetical protein
MPKKRLNCCEQFRVLKTRLMNPYLEDAPQLLVDDLTNRQLCTRVSSNGTIRFPSNSENHLTRCPACPIRNRLCSDGADKLGLTIFISFSTYCRIEQAVVRPRTLMVLL